MSPRIGRCRVLALRALADRQLLIAGWVDGPGLGPNVSRPGPGHPDGGGIRDEPFGVEVAPALADACGRADAGGELAERSARLDSSRVA